VSNDAEPLPVRRILEGDIVHGVKHDITLGEITWCDRFETRRPDPGWNGFSFPMPLAAAWSTAPVSCFECLDKGGPNG
jgi:hypothetical protein